MGASRILNEDSRDYPSSDPNPDHLVYCPWLVLKTQVSFQGYFTVPSNIRYIYDSITHQPTTTNIHRKSFTLKTT